MAKGTNSLTNVLEIFRINSLINNDHNFDPEICRICLLVVKDNLDMICINSIKMNAQETPLRDKLYFCCPELDLHINSRARLCLNCYKTIIIIYEFTHRYDKSKKQLNEHFTFAFSSIQNLPVFENCSLSSNNEIKTEEVDLYDTEKDFTSKHSQIQNITKQFKHLQNNCKICIHTENKLLRHLQMNIEEKPYQCSVCEYSCTKRIHLENHLRIHTGEKPFKCFLCGFSCTRKYNLKSHLHSHTREKPFKCFHCNYSCIWKSNLNNHLRIHTGERPFNCPSCDSSFTQKCNLERHMHIHTGKKSFRCLHCNFSCMRKSQMKSHLHILAGKKAFKCSHCNFSCVQQCKFKTHLRIHIIVKRFKCSMCDYSSNINSHLEGHLRIHTGERPYKCSYCDFSFAHNGNLKRHMRTTHAGIKFS